MKRTHSVTTYVHPGSITSSVTFDIYECLMSFFHFVTIDDTPKTKRYIKPEKWWCSLGDVFPEAHFFRRAMKKNPGCWRYLKEYTTQLCGDYFINHDFKDPVMKKPVFHGSCHWWAVGFLRILYRLDPLGPNPECDRLVTTRMFGWKLGWKVIGSVGYFTPSNTPHL